MYLSVCMLYFTIREEKFNILDTSVSYFVGGETLCQGSIWETEPLEGKPITNVYVYMYVHIYKYIFLYRILDINLFLYYINVIIYVYIYIYI